MKTNEINRMSRSVPAPPDMPRKRPVYEVRLGFIKAAIWENATGDSVRYNVSFSRLYKNKDETEWKTTDTFGRDDLLVLAKVADQAHTWVCAAAKGDR
jgi:hypothetical protein